MTPLERVAAATLQRLTTHRGWLAGAQLRRATPARDRPLLNTALQHLTDQGLITELPAHRNHRGHGGTGTHYTANRSTPRPETRAPSSDPMDRPSEV